MRCVWNNLWLRLFTKTVSNSKNTTSKTSYNIFLTSTILRLKSLKSEIGAELQTQKYKIIPHSLIHNYHSNFAINSPQITKYYDDICRTIQTCIWFWNTYLGVKCLVTWDELDVSGMNKKGIEGGERLCFFFILHFVPTKIRTVNLWIVLTFVSRICRTILVYF